MVTSSTSLPSFTILDGKVHVYMRDGSPYWWAGFHHKGKYIRKTTKERDKGGAESVARQWYFKVQTEIESGQISSPKHAFEKVAELALAHYKTLVDRGIRSQKTLDGIKSILESRVTPYFKKTSVTQIDNQAWHRFKEDILIRFPLVKRGTLHQYKNGIRVVLNEAYRIGYIKELPVFKDEYSNRKIDSPRPWFDASEYKKLHMAIAAHARQMQKVDRLHHQNALELYDYVLFATNTGMRVGELKNVKFRDVKIVKDRLEKDKEFLIISDIKGKRGTGTCQSYYGAVSPFRRIIERRGIKNPRTSDENLFLIHHRVMFNVILEKTGLKYSKSIPPAKRDFVSLRATYICFRLLNGVPIYEIANNCRTSVQMIEQSYAKHLGGRLMPNINRTTKEQEGWDY